MENNVFVGMKHGYLTVIRDLGRGNGGHHKFECRCACGALVSLRKTHFYPERRFCTRSCPLLCAQRASDIVGKRFGMLKVLGPDGSKTYGGKKRLFWECICDCGNTAIVLADHLQDGKTTSCGCWSEDCRRLYWTPADKLVSKRKNANKYARANPAKLAAHSIAYANRLRRATPPWLTKEHWDAMNAFYEEARRKTVETGIRHDVDHIVPINGKNVCGLHVPWNLQVLTQSENVAKSNRYADHHGDMVKPGIKSPSDNKCDKSLI